MKNVGVVIIGGGMTGISVARLLQQSGTNDFVVLEQEQHADGLCRTRMIGNHVLDLGGGHLLCSKYPDVYDFIFSHLPRSEFQEFKRVSPICLGEHVIDYPIEYNLWQLPIDKRVQYLIACIQAGESRNGDKPQSFRQWVKWKLGDPIADDYMIPYNEKIWGVDPDELDTDWLEKIPPFDLQQVVAACLQRGSDMNVMPSHPTFYYPNKGGFQTIFDAIFAPVSEKVSLGTPVKSLRRDGDEWVVNETFTTKLVINTIPWTTLHGAVKNAPDVVSELSRIKTSSLVITLHEVPFSNNWHWSYIPDLEVPHHRNFFIPNFAPHSAPNGVFRETNGQRFDESNGSLHTHHNQHAYPVPVRGHTAAADHIWKTYAELGVVGVGRWGQHRYYNADVCIREAMQLVQGYARDGMAGAILAMSPAQPRTLT